MADRWGIRSLVFVSLISVGVAQVPVRGAIASESCGSETVHAPASLDVCDLSLATTTTEGGGVAVVATTRVAGSFSDRPPVARYATYWVVDGCEQWVWYQVATNDPARAWHATLVQRCPSDAHSRFTRVDDASVTTTDSTLSVTVASSLFHNGAILEGAFASTEANCGFIETPSDNPVTGGNPPHCGVGVDETQPASYVIGGG